MSEENMNEESKEEMKTISVEDFEKLQATNERILAEHKADKNKWKSRLSEYEAKDREILEKNNDHVALREKAEAELAETRAALSEAKYNSFEKNLTLEVAKLCKDAYSPGQIMRALKVNTDNTDLDNGTLTDLSHQIDELRKGEPNLFMQQQQNQTTTVPRYMKGDGGSEKTVGEMTSSEIENTLRARAAKRA